jgi:lipopolysaccharide transport system permease protein
VNDTVATHRAPSVRIAPAAGLSFPDLGEVWRHRELLQFLVWRDVKVRYKQTVLGAGWAVVQPFVTMVVFSVVFGRLASVPSEGLPYPIFAFAGLLPWQMFAFALTESTNSLVASQHVITKVYFPRLIVPLASTAVSILDFCVAFLVLAAMMVFYGVELRATALLVPAFVLMAVLTATAAGLWLSALNVRYRDVRHVVPFLIQIWLFLSPIAYPSSLVPAKWQWLYGLNPMAGVVEGFRWALLGTPAPKAPLMVASGCVVLCLLAGGLVYFRKTERTLADVI